MHPRVSLSRMNSTAKALFFFIYRQCIEKGNMYRAESTVNYSAAVSVFLRSFKKFLKLD